MRREGMEAERWDSRTGTQFALPARAPRYPALAIALLAHQEPLENDRGGEGGRAPAGAPPSSPGITGRRNNASAGVTDAPRRTRCSPRPAICRREISRLSS